jgi:hypothetical protein
MRKKYFPSHIFAILGCYAVLVGGYRRFGTERLSQNVLNRKSTLRNFPEERRPHLHLNGNLKPSPTSQRLEFIFKISGSVERLNRVVWPTDGPTFWYRTHNCLLTSKLQWGMLAQAVTLREVRGSNLAWDPDCCDPGFSCFSQPTQSYRYDTLLCRCYFHVLFAVYCSPSWAIHIRIVLLAECTVK